MSKGLVNYSDSDDDGREDPTPDGKDANIAKAGNENIVSIYFYMIIVFFPLRTSCHISRTLD